MGVYRRAEEKKKKSFSKTERFPLARHVSFDLAKSKSTRPDDLNTP